MTWHVKIPTEAHIECSLIPKSPAVYMEAVPRIKIELLLEAYPHQEWLGYLRGIINEQGSICVSDISIPPHKEAGAASAEAEPFHIPADCVGIIHSHHSMGAFHSGTDAAYVDKNFPCSITVAKRSGQGIEYDTVSYQVTPCGKATTGKSEVKYVQPKPQFDTVAWLAAAKANVDKPKQVVTRKQNSLYQKSFIQPRDPKGKFMPKEQAYLPMRYRSPLKQGDYVVDAHGHVLNDTELLDILYNSKEV